MMYFNAKFIYRSLIGSISLILLCSQVGADDGPTNQEIFAFGEMSALHHSVLTSREFLSKDKFKNNTPIREMTVGQLLAYSPEFITYYTSGAIFGFANVSKTLQRPDIADCFMKLAPRADTYIKSLLEEGYIYPSNPAMLTIRNSCGADSIIDYGL